MLIFHNDSPSFRPAATEPVSPPSAAWELLGRELLRAHRVAYDHLERDDVDWLCQGFRAFLASEGKIPLERCLRLPTSARALRRARRDHWLRRAWNEMGDDVSPWRRSEMLATEIRRFATGRWLRWTHLEHIPAGASALDEALFEAFRSHERIPSTAMQLHNITQRAGD